MAVELMAVTELEERQKPNGFREEVFEVEIRGGVNKSLPDLLPDVVGRNR